MKITRKILPKFLKKMSKICEICGKKPSRGNNVSHSKRITKRTFGINLQKKKIFNPKDGNFVKVNICTSCLRSLNKIV